MTAGIANAGHGPGLVSHWPGDGNANDVHGANPASLVGGAGFGSGQVGTGSFSLPNPSQGNDYVSIPDTPTLHSATDLTVTGWFKVHDLLKSTLWQSVFWKGNTPDCTTGCENREYALFLHNQGSLHLVATPVSRIRIGQLGAATPAGTVAPGQWYHFAAVISSSENRVTLYLNGAQVAGAAFDPSGIRDTTGPLRIGNNPSWDSGFNGLIDGVELYHRVLSVPEISTLAGGAAGVDSFTNGPVSYWPAEDDANDAVDGHHGTLSPLAGFALSQAGMGKAFRLGGPDYVTAPDSPELRLGTNQTVALWYKWDGGGPSDWRRLVGKGASASRNYGLWVHPQANSILFQIYDGSQVCNAQAFPSSDTEWHQLTGTYDGARIRLFYDGVLVRDMPCTMTPPVSSDPLTIGYANAGVAPFHSPFDGLIDDVQIHNVALDNCAILELAGDTCRLVSHWAGEDGPADSVGPNNGTEQSGIAYASGQVGRAFSIDGLDDHILVPSSASLSSYQDFTYSFWIKWLGVTHSGWQQILAKHAPGSDRSLGVWNCRTTAGSTTVKGIHWRTTPGNPGSGCLGPNGENTNFELNQWYHLAGVKEGATLKVYIDGVQVGVTYPAAAPMIQGPGNLYIGRSPSYRPVNALIDEVKLYNYALTASDIETEFIEGDNQPPEADAGEDQIGIEATSPAGAEVTLDGTGSDDPDEDTLTYVWTGVFGSTTGPTPTVTVPLGSHEITLTVDDGNGETSDDTVNVSVLDTTAPEITAPPDIVLAASGPITSVDLGTPTVSDLVDPAPSVDNDAPPGFPVGVTVVTWTATDANSNPAQAEQTVTVTNDPPVANAGFDPIKVEDDEGTFAIVAGGSDPNNNLASVTAVILTPSLDGLEVKLKTKSLVKVSFDLEDGEVKIEGPDPQAILDQIENLGGILVENGQITKIELDDDGEEATFKFDKNGDLKIEAGAVVLMVTATDAEGESGTATASPDFGSEEDDDEDDDEDEDDEDEDDDD